MKILVTGGAGFIGSNIVEKLLTLGYNVRVLDNFSTGKRENLQPYLNDIELVEGDLRSYHVVLTSVKNCEIIFHQGALPSVPRSINDPITSNEVNVIGTLNILEAAKGSNVKRIVFASSSSVYGDNPQLPKHEDMIPNPLSPYAVSKLAGENYCKVFSRLYDIETVALRYFNVFGKRQDPSSQYAAVIPKFISLIKQGKRPIIFGDGLQSRDFTYVDNVVEANILAAFAEGVNGKVFNCACGERIELIEVVKKINTILGKNLQPIFKPERNGDVKHSLADINLIGKYLGYKPRIKFEVALKELLLIY
jgi:UDP-glucose 4-epimerase